MTVTNVQRLRSAARPLPVRASLAGLVVGMCAALGTTASAAPAASNPSTATAQPGSAIAIDPAKSLPSTVSISGIDFKRGDGGAGRLILHFSGDGAAPDLRTQGSSVLVDIGNAQLPASLQKPLDVTDFATPVQRIDAVRSGNGARLQLTTSGQFESLAYQTGRDYIVEVVPRATAQAENRAVGAVSSTVAAGAQSSAVGTPRYGGRPVTFNFQDVPVRTVLQLIAEESNLNVVAADTVQGNVTLRLVNVPWDQALDLVLQAKGLDKRQSGNVVWIAPQPEIAKYEQDKAEARVKLENSAEMVTEYIPINYGNAEDIAKLLTDEAKNGKGGGGAGESQRGFLSPRGSISFDRRTNTLLVIDIPKRVEAIRDLVNKLDKPVDQVVIEARIVIANESFARELGAKFGISGKARTQTNVDGSTDGISYGSKSVGGGSPPTGGLNLSLPSALAGGTGSLALSILNAGYALDLELSALQQEGRGEIISNPRIVTSNQKEALIKQGDQIGYITVTGGNNANVPQVQFKDVVLQLKVTPTITNDGRIFLNMDLQKDDLSGYVNTGVGQVPQIATREVTTAVLVEDGQTVVVGGVYEFKDQNSMSKVPFLGDIPILGNLFKNRNHTKSKAELLVFVTPKVIRVAQRPN